MAEPLRHRVTQLLLEWSGGDRGALDDLMPLVTDELRRLAGSFLVRERSGHTLQATALVNELYLKLVDRRRVDWRSRAQFFAFAAQSMRRILIDHARSHRASKRGSGAPRVTLDEARNLAPAADFDLIALDDSLTALSALHPEQGRIVELRCFGGLSIRETAEVLGTSERSVSRGWTAARAWLFRELSGVDPAQGSSPGIEPTDRALTGE